MTPAGGEKLHPKPGPIARAKALVRPIIESYAVRFVREVVRRFGEDQGAVLAGYIAYSAMLALFPFMIFTITLAGSIIGQGYSNDAIAALFDWVPDHVAKTLEPVLLEVIGERRGGVLTISGLGALYAASNGVEAIRIGLDRAYDIHEKRGFIRNRLLSIGFVLIGLVCFGLLALLIVFAPLVFVAVEEFTTFKIPASADIARYIVGSALLYTMLWALHRLLPARPMHWKRLWPGIFFSMVLGVLLATGLSIYVSNSPNYTLTYGALAGVIVTLLFFFLTGVSIILGAEVNAVINFGVPPLEEEK